MRLTRVTLLLIALIIGLGFVRLSSFLLEGLEAQTFQASEESMVDSSQLLASQLESIDTSSKRIDFLQNLFSRAKERNVDATIFKLEKTSIGLHAYLTDDKGIVIFDSHTPERIGQDLSRNNDVYLTLEGRYGSRSSRTNPDDPLSSILYIAAPVRSNERVVHCLTFYKKQSDVRPFIKQRRRTIVSAITLIGLGIIGLITAVFLWLFRPIGQLTEYARAITRGQRQSAPTVGHGREVNTLKTALVNMREALEGRRYAEQYVQTLTHEIKSPLAAIRGASELLQEDMPKDDRDRFLENIKQETQRSETLINRLLTLAALEGRSHLEHTTPLKWEELVKEALSECRPLADNKSITFDFQTSLSFPIEGDREILILSICNLIENAIDFSPENSTITIFLESPSDFHQLSIIDEGPGLSDFAMERAFERFFSHREGIARKGSGLGLSFVKEAADLHGGFIEVSNNFDTKGAIAKLSLPRTS